MTAARAGTGIGAWNGHGPKAARTERAGLLGTVRTLRGWVRRANLIADLRVLFGIMG